MSTAKLNDASMPDWWLAFAQRSDLLLDRRRADALADIEELRGKLARQTAALAAIDRAIVIQRDRNIAVNVRALELARSARRDRNGYVKCPLCGAVKLPGDKLAAHLRADDTAELLAAAAKGAAAA